MLLFKIINFVSIKLSNFKIYRILILYKLNSKYKHFNKFRDFSFNSQSVFIDITNRGKVSMYKITTIVKFLATNLIQAHSNT